jgi:hypothetical protein
LSVDQVFILYYPECLAQTVEAWAAKG